MEIIGRGVLARLAYLVLFGLLVCYPINASFAQYDGPDNALAYGRGPGNTGLDFLGPGTIPGLPIYSGSAGTPPRIGGELTVAPSTSYTVTTDDCGRVFINNNPTAPQTYTLPQTVSALKGCEVGFRNSTNALVTVSVFSGEQYFFGALNQAIVQGTFPLTSVNLIVNGSAIYLRNTGGTGGTGWSVTSHTPDILGSANGFYYPTPGTIIFDAAMDYAHGYPDDDPPPYNGGYTARFSAADGGGIQLKNPVTGEWQLYQVFDSATIDLSCVTIDGVTCQSAETNTLYHVYLYASGAPPNNVAVELSETTFETASGNLFQVKTGDSTRRWAGYLTYIAASHLTQNGTLSPGTDTAITGLTNTTYLQKGQEIRGTGITRTSPPCRVNTIDSATQVTPMTCTVTGTGATSLQFPSLVMDPLGIFGQGVQIPIASAPTLLTNNFGVQACQGQTNSGTGDACVSPTWTTPSKSATATQLDARQLSVKITTNGTKMPDVVLTGKVSGTIAGRRICVQIRPKSVTTGAYTTTSQPECVRVVASGAEMDISAAAAQPWAPGTYDYQVFHWEPDGTGDVASFLLQMTVKANSP